MNQETIEEMEERFALHHERTAMTTEQTVAIIKPGAVSRGVVGRILTEIEATLSIERIESMWLTKAQASAFYAEHQDKPFFPGLIAHATSGPCVALVLSGVEAIARWRALMGPTDPDTTSKKHQAWWGIRQCYGTALPDNAVHGSDSPEAYRREHAILWPVGS